MAAFKLGIIMKNDAIQKIKNTRLARQAQIDSGLREEFKKLQREIVIQSFAHDFDVKKHRAMMEQLKMLK